MIEGQPNSAEQQFQQRINELSNRLRVLETLKVERTLDLVRNLYEQPNEQNFHEVIDQVIKNGLESGRLTTDLCWISSLSRVKLPTELILRIWDVKDKEQRETYEDMQSAI